MQQTLEGFQLSLQQERLWSLRERKGLKEACCFLQITGPVDPPLVEKALATLLSRHEIFRTTFQRLPGMKLPVQVLNEKPAYSWRRQSEPGDQQRVRAELLLEACEFDLEHGPLCHGTLRSLDEQTHLLCLRFPAFSADARTLLLCAQELPQLYFHLQQSQEEEIAPYLQFSEWQKAVLEDEENIAERDLWRQSYTREDVALPLPLEKPEGESAVAPAFFTFALPERARIVRCLEEEHCALSALFAACWSILLWRFTGQARVLFGLEMDGRIYEELEEMRGPLAKYVPFSLTLSGQDLFQDVLSEVQKSYVDLSERQAYFVYEDILPKGESDLYESSVQCLIYPADVTNGSTTFSVQHCVCTDEPAKIKLIGVERGEALTCEIHYQPDFYTPADIQRIAESFSTLIAQIIETRSIRVQEINLVSAGEQYTQLYTLNQTRAAYQPEFCVHELFEQQAAATPEAIAVQAGEMQLTFGALNQRANQLARYLRRQGLEVETCVGLCQERTVELLIALLGILKAGGTYIPLETVYPQERLAFMLNDARLTTVITQSYLRERLPALPLQVCLDQDWPRLERESQENLPHGTVRPENLAYILYTSGSTGQPKGVMIPHQGLTHYVQWSSAYYAVRAGSGAPVHSPLSFDLTITSLFVPLVGGRKVVLVPEAQGIEALLATVRQGYDFSLLKITPAHLDLLGRALEPEDMARVARVLVIGGEALYADTLAPWQRYAPQTRLINEYGPTETVVGCCIYELAEQEAHGHVPIGRPIANTQLYVLDPLLRPVPRGQPGELYIGGVGLGRGYLWRPDLTAERFVAHPFSREPGQRLYKTGDLVRYCAEDGTLEYLGRTDRQVKLRGYRIELDEIEFALKQHEHIQDAAVVLRQERLEAYLVSDEPAPGEAELRTFLGQILGEYMIPSAFTFLKYMPLTPNGKVDWKLLLSKDGLSEEIRAAEANAAQVLVQPRDAIEHQLLQIWQDVLQRPLISVVDNFFDLGGHSMLAVSLLARILKQFGRDLPLASLFLHPTIADLGMLLRQQINTQSPRALVTIQRRGEKTPFFCIHPSGGNVYCYVNLAQHLGRTFYGLQTPDPDEQTFASIEEMAAYYLSLIREVQPQGPYLLGGWSMGGLVAFEIAQQLDFQGQEVSLLAIFDSLIAEPEKRGRVEPEEVSTGVSDAEVVEELISHFEIEAPDNFAQFQIEEQVSYVVDQAKKLHGFTGDVTFEQVRRIVSIKRANSRLSRLYIPQPYQHSIDYFISDDSWNFSGNSPRGEHDEPGDYCLRPWRTLVSGDVRVHHIPGRHTELIEEPNVQELARALLQSRGFTA